MPHEFLQVAASLVVVGIKLFTNKMINNIDALTSLGIVRVVHREVYRWLIIFIN